MLFFADRTRRASDYPWLAWKVRMFVAGSVLAVFGMVRDDNRILALATVVLLIGFLMRFLPGGRGIPEESTEDAEADHDPWADPDTREEGQEPDDEPGPRG